MFLNSHADTAAVALIARAIGNCDFRVKASKDGKSPDSPWIITVGESTWQRHILVKELLGDADATLTLLGTTQSIVTPADADVTDIANDIQLSELIAGRYIGVKSALKPALQAA